MALSEQSGATVAATLQDATTGEPINTPTPKTSGDTHQTSGPSGPDPTGLRGSLERNAAKVQEKLAAAAGAAATERNDAKGGVSRETEGQRGADGKFLPKAATDPQAAAKVSEPDEPPSSWRSETKALWKEIDAKFGPEQGKMLKEELRKREGDFRKGLADKDGEVATIKTFHGELQPLLARHEHLWKDQGITGTKAVEHLLSLNENFRRDPAGTIKWLAQSAGLDLSTLAGGQKAAQTADPQLEPLYQTVSGLQSKLHEIQTQWQSQTTAAAAAEIQSVIDEKGPDGNPVRPYFNDVFKDIQTEIHLLRQQHPDWGARQIATSAYDTAVWRNPDVRQKMMDGASAQKRASEDAEQRQRAAEAAAKNVRGGPPNHLNGATNANNLRGTLEAKVNAYYGGGSRF